MASQSQSSSKRIKFSRLCLSQSRATKDGQSSNSVQSSQISKFFNRPVPTDNNNPSTSTFSATQSNIDENKVTTEDSKNAKQSETDETSTSSSEAKAKEPKTTKRQHTGEREETKRLFDASNPIVDANKTIKNFFAAEHSESLGDFEVPKKVARTNSKTASTTTKRAKSTKSCSKKQPDIRKILKKQTDGIDLDEDEELRLVMELSKAESDERMEQANFEQFEYKPKNGSKELASIFGAQKASRVQSKWKSKCTPLTRRDDEVQSLRKRERVNELLIDNILIESRKSRESDNTVARKAEFVFDVSSSLLQRICMAEKILFALDDNDVQSDRCLHQYYTNNIVEPSMVAVGALLRDWSRIPGRDSVFDGIPTALETAQEAIDVEPSEIVHSQNEPEECVEHVSPEPGPSEIRGETEIDSVESSEVMENVTASAETDDTIIVDANAIEVELNLINSRMRSSQHFVELPAPAVGCDSATIATESHRGPSPDLFDDDDYDYDANCLESGSLSCASKQTSQDNSTILVEDSPPVEANESNNEIVVNETLLSPTPSVNLSDDDKCSLIEISDESSQSTITEHENKEEDKVELKEEYTVATPPDYAATPPDCAATPPDCAATPPDCVATPPDCAATPPDCVATPPDCAAASTSLRKVLSFTERLELMDRDVSEEFKMDVPVPTTEFESQPSQQLSQESVDLSDDEINYSMNFGRRSLVVEQQPTSPTSAADYGLGNYNAVNDFNFDYGIDGGTDLELVNQSICEMFEKTFEYRDAGTSEGNRDKSITPKQNSKKWKKTRSERVLGTKRCQSPVSSIRTDSNHIASTALPPTDLSTDDYIIQYGSLSPKPDYDSMEPADLQQELKKFGLKQSLKKRQAIICLEYIYNRTHPYIEGDAPDANSKTSKTKNGRLIATEPNIPNEAKLNFNVGFAHDQLVDAKFQRVQVERFFMPSWPRAKRPWCLQPLHIAWHNLIKANRELFQTVLAYKPIELRDLKNYFKTIDMTFDNKDLIAFLDIHCITFRTSKNSNNN